MNTKVAQLSNNRNKVVWLLIVLNVIYLLAEFSFNTKLLNTASWVDVNADELLFVENFGRTVSGVGFGLFVIGLVLWFMHWIEPRISADWQRPALLSPVLLILLLPFSFNLADSNAWFAIGVLATGLFALFSAFNRSTFFMGIGLFFSAWLAMFAGQKILIDHFLVEKSAAEQRETAHYMSMLKVGIVKDVVKIQGAPFDLASMKNPEESTFLILLGALGVGTPEFIDLVKDHESELANLVNEKIAEEKLPKAYANYSAKKDAFLKNDWAKYSKGSEEYGRNLRDSTAMANNDYREFRNELSVHYNDYNNGVAKFKSELRNKAGDVLKLLKYYQERQSVCDGYEVKYDNGYGKSKCTNGVSADYANDSKKYAKGKVIPFTYWCDKREARVDEAVVDKVGSVWVNGISALQRFVGNKNAEDAKPVEHYDCNFTLDSITNKLAALEDSKSEFIKRTGYDPGIKTFEEFVDNKITVNKAREALQRRGLVMPASWKVGDAETFKKASESKRVQEIQKRWATDIASVAGSYIPPGLSASEFAAQPAVQRKIKDVMGDSYVEGMTFDYSEREFMDRVIKPAVARKTKEAIEKYRNDAASFADGQPREEEGKSIYRAVMIPPISLFLSLFFGLLSFGKICVTLAEKGLHTFRHSGEVFNVPLKYLMLMLFVIVVITLPMSVHNKFSESAALKYFTDETKIAYPFWTLLGKWTISVQPAMYPIGHRIVTAYESTFGVKPVSQDDSGALKDVGNKYQRGKGNQAIEITLDPEAKPSSELVNPSVPAKVHIIDSPIEKPAVAPQVKQPVVKPAAAIDADSAGMLDMAEAAIESSEFAQARDLADQVLQKYPNNARALRILDSAKHRE